RLSDLRERDLDWFEGREDVWLTPEHYADERVNRYVEVDDRLMTLLGFFVAEGSCSDRGGVRLTLGNGNARYATEMTAALESAFGLPSRLYRSGDRAAEIRLVNRVAALAWRHVFGCSASSSVDKRIPDLVWNVSPPLRAAFLRGYLLGDGTACRGCVA